MKVLSVVRLSDGRVGTILEVFDEGKALLIEIVDDHGKTIDMPMVKREDVVDVIYAG